MQKTSLIKVKYALAARNQWRFRGAAAKTPARTPTDAFSAE